MSIPPHVHTLKQSSKEPLRLPIKKSMMKYYNYFIFLLPIAILVSVVDIVSIGSVKESQTNKANNSRESSLEKYQTP